MRWGNFLHLSLVHLRKKGPLNTPNDTKNLAKNKRINGQDAHSPHSQGWLCHNYFCLIRVFRGQAWLSLFLRQLRGQIDCSDHAIGARDTFAGDIERGAVIGAGAWKG